MQCFLSPFLAGLALFSMRDNTLTHSLTVRSRHGAQVCMVKPKRKSEESLWERVFPDQRDSDTALGPCSCILCLEHGCGSTVLEAAAGIVRAHTTAWLSREDTAIATQDILSHKIFIHLKDSDS